MGDSTRACLGLGARWQEERCIPHWATPSQLSPGWGAGGTLPGLQAGGLLLRRRPGVLGGPSRPACTQNLLRCRNAHGRHATVSMQGLPRFPGLSLSFPSICVPPSQGSGLAGDRARGPPGRLVCRRLCSHSYANPKLESSPQGKGTENQACTCHCPVFVSLCPRALASAGGSGSPECLTRQSPKGAFLTSVWVAPGTPFENRCCPVGIVAPCLPTGFIILINNL